MPRGSNSSGQQCFPLALSPFLYCWLVCSSYHISPSGVRTPQLHLLLCSSGLSLQHARHFQPSGSLLPQNPPYYGATHSTLLAKAFPDILQVKGALQSLCTHGNKHMTLIPLSHLHCPPLNAYCVPGTASGLHPHWLLTWWVQWPPPFYKWENQDASWSDWLWVTWKIRKCVTFYVWLQTRLFLYHTSDSQRSWMDT